MTATVTYPDVTLRLPGHDLAGAITYDHRTQRLQLTHLDGETEVLSIDLVLDGYVARPGEVFVKDWSEHVGLTDALTLAGIVAPSEHLEVGPFRSRAYRVRVLGPMGGAPMTSITADTTPRVWPGCLNCYNNGRLVGRWVDCTDADNVTLDFIHEGTGGPYEGCEEIWCLDHENIPQRGEMGLSEAAEWGRAYSEVGPERWPAFCAWVESGAYAGDGDTPSVPDFEEACQGQWDSFREYAEQLTENIRLTDGWPEEARRYFDWDAWTRDLRHDYTVADAPDGGVFVFRNS